MKVVCENVDMVAWFTREGKPHPVRFRIKDEEGAFKVIKVDRILFVEKERLAGNAMLVFRCQSLIDGIERIYELKYELNAMCWILYKI